MESNLKENFTQYPFIFLMFILYICIVVVAIKSKTHKNVVNSDKYLKQLNTKIDNGSIGSLIITTYWNDSKSSVNHNTAIGYKALAELDTEHIWKAIPTGNGIPYLKRVK